MTKKKLSQLYYLRKEINILRDKIANLEAQATKLNSEISDMPRGFGNNDKLGLYISEILYHKEMLTAKLMQYRIEERRLTDYINAIEDSCTRAIFRLRFVELHSWNAIADIIGNEATEDSIKKKCYRFLKKY